MEMHNLCPVKCLVEKPSLNGAEWRAEFSLFTNVQNSTDIHKSLMKGEIQAALIKPSMVTDIFQVNVAANRALRSQLLNKMATKSIYTEVLYNLSPTKKIANALQTFGISDKHTEILVVVLTTEVGDDKSSIVRKKIDGELVSLSSLVDFRNEKAIRKIYKISDKELEMSSFLDSVLGRMACKDFLVI